MRPKREKRIATLASIWRGTRAATQGLVKVACRGRELATLERKDSAGAMMLTIEAGPGNGYDTESLNRGGG